MKLIFLDFITEGFFLKDIYKATNIHVIQPLTRKMSKLQYRMEQILLLILEKFWIHVWNIQQWNLRKVEIHSKPFCLLCKARISIAP